jgi:hypothetical protein
VFITATGKDLLTSFLNHESPNCGPHACVMWPAIIFVNYVSLHLLLPYSAFWHVQSLFQKRVLHSWRLRFSSFNFQYPLFSLRSSSILEGSSYARYDQLNYPYFFLMYVWYSCLPWFHVILSHLSHDRSSWSSPSFCTTKVEIPQGRSNCVYTIKITQQFKHLSIPLVLSSPHAVANQLSINVMALCPKMTGDPRSICCGRWYV